MARKAVLRELNLENFFEEDKDDEWLFEDSGEESENETMIRRPYSNRTRAELDEWDDVSFYERFRMTKRTFRRVVELVEPHLTVAHRR